MEIDLKGKVAIVTGAGRGIGLEIARTFAREGVRTVVTDINDTALKNVTDEFAREGWDGKQILCDVRDQHAVDHVIRDVVDSYGKIDILVNNAGVAPGGFVEDITEEVWDLNLEVNLKGTFLMCQAVIPVMKHQRSGRIINAASYAAIIPSIGQAAYAASKAGIVNFTRTLAGELGPWNITVNAYAPGMIPTELNNFADAPPRTKQRLLDTLTLRRWGTAADVANLVCFLASDLAAYITGTVIDVSGGKLATQSPRVAYERGPLSGRYGY